MGNVEQIAGVIAGLILPVLISLIKSKVTLNKEQASALVFVSCFGIAMMIELINNKFNFNDILARIAEIYLISQAVYWGVMKTLELDRKIEG